jgi:nitrous oxidase accessory protein
MHIFLFIFLILSTGRLLSKEIVVNPGGPIKTIRHAIEIAQNGDKILIRKGRYAEGNIAVNKSVTIAGVDWPVIDGEGKWEIFTVNADDVTIEGLIFQNAGISYIQENAAVKLKKIKNASVVNNIFEMNFFAVYLANAWNCTVRNNRIRSVGTTESSSGNGIHLWSCRNITIENNTIHGHRDGIYFEFVKDSRIIDNISESNMRYGLHFMFSDSCLYTRNTFRKNSAGVAVMYTRGVAMLRNTFEKNWGPASYGLLLKDISDSGIEGNVFSGNSTGLYVEGSVRIKITKNNFFQNGWALKLMANSNDNVFSENNFEGNSFDVATNSRKNFNTFHHNYWSAYSGYDLDRDGIGDVPYRPVSLFSILTQKQPETLILLRSFFISVLDMAEKILPILTPETLMDATPMMRRVT